jgi:hypothetical protein
MPRTTSHCLTNCDDYDDDLAVADYVQRNDLDLMTDFERRSLHLAIKRELAEVSETAADRLPAWVAQEDEAVVRASLSEKTAIRQQINDRIAKSLKDGSLVINRCPKCNRVVRTPLAQQCLWCGHDWHLR